MNSLFNIDKFIKVFSKQEYRKKLDKIILNFFGLENKTIVNNCEIKENDIILEFLIFIDKNYVFKIIVKDYKHLFKTSKKFYINFSNNKFYKNYTLLYPCYWEFYCTTCLKSNYRKKQLETVASLFAVTTKKELKNILKDLKIFNNNEINDIMNIIEE